MYTAKKKLKTLETAPMSMTKTATFSYLAPFQAIRQMLGKTVLVKMIHGLVTSSK